MKEKHPSGKPKLNNPKKDYPYTGFTQGPRTPGLQKTRTNAIGFVLPNEGWAEDDTDLSSRSG